MQRVLRVVEVWAQESRRHEGRLGGAREGDLCCSS